jgi:hypothetical protein
LGDIFHRVVFLSLSAPSLFIINVALVSSSVPLSNKLESLVVEKTVGVTVDTASDGANAGAGAGADGADGADCAGVDTTILDAL